MPALPADIAAASRDVITVTWSDATIAARYPGARDGSVKPAEGYFDSAADAQAVINARGALIGTERRRFTATAGEVIWPTISTAVPTVQLVDVEQAADLSCLVARIEIDLENDTTTYELFG